MRGTLEGLESCWESPGMGEHEGSFLDGPTVGKPFVFFPDEGPTGTTSPVQSVRLLVKGPDYEIWGFRTLNSTYRLRVRPDAKESECL